MRLEVPDNQRTVTDYDFSFSSSHFLSVTIDPKYDSIEFGEKEIKVMLGGRERNGVKAPAEELTIFKTYLISYAKKERVVNELTPDEVEDIKILIKGGSKLIH
jgi:hypothetical protein